MKSTLPSLNAIGIKYGTDKSSDHHNYLNFYERFFTNIREKPLKFLEVGVFRGASLKTWKEYFPNANIVGADIDNNSLTYKDDRIEISILDQSNLQDLVNLGVQHGPFDVILEDGSHQWEHQIITLKTLFPFLKNGGYYIIEDLQTNFGDLTEKYKGVSTISCVDYLKKLVDYRVGGNQLDPSKEEDAFLRTFSGSIGFIAFYRHACLIEKMQKEFFLRGQKYTDNPLTNIVSGIDTGLVKIMAHIANSGDVVNDQASFINIAEFENRFIQGFELRVDASLEQHISYRARLASGAWSPWVYGNTFVGSRGQGEDLTGFSVRLHKALESDYDLALFGNFSGDTTTVVVQGGEDCVSKKTFGTIRGMQIILKRKI